MPSADFSPNQPQSESTELNHPSMPGTEDQTEQEWQTVDFPDAISVDQLPVVDEAESTPVSTPSFLEIAPQTQPKVEQPKVEQPKVEQPKVEQPKVEQPLKRDNSTEIIQALQQCNQDLVDRIAQLEAELDICQKTLQDKEAILNQHNQKLALATDQVTRLFGKQELSNQVIQRQQVLVESLSQQWEESQRKMAQIERDCALTQQRYNEQFHELMQTQNLCRDLRSRLHRQQRHTLQFKVALERSLEMQSRFGRSLQVSPSLNSPELIANISTSPTLPLQPEPETEPTQTPSVSKAPPVQPWSMQSAEEDESVEILEDMIQHQENDLFDSYPAEIEPQPPEINQPLSDQLQQLETDWYVEQSTESSPTPRVETPRAESISFNLEALDKAELIEDELDRIQAEYASLNLENKQNEELELDRLESFPQAFPQAPPQSTPPQPQTIESESSHSDLSWPVPLIRPKQQRKLRSLASIELPKLPKTSYPAAEAESLSMQEFAEIETF